MERDPSWVEAILTDGQYRPEGPVRFEGIASMHDKDVLLSLEVRVPLAFRCCRCGEESRFEYGPRVHHLFVSGDGDNVSLPVDVELDPEADLTEGAGSRIDCEPAVSEAFAVELDLYPVCSEDCPGPSELKAADEDEEKSEERKIDPRLAPLLAIKLSLEQEKKPAGDQHGSCHGTPLPTDEPHELPN